MKRDGETYTLSTGREIRAHRGILGLEPIGRGYAEEWESRIYEGYDGQLHVGEKPSQPGALTAAERREIADYMIREWDEWAKELEG